MIKRTMYYLLYAYIYEYVTTLTNNISSVIVN